MDYLLYYYYIYARAAVHMVFCVLSLCIIASTTNHVQSFSGCIWRLNSTLHVADQNHRQPDTTPEYGYAGDHI